MFRLTVALTATVLTLATAPVGTTPATTILAATTSTGMTSVATASSEPTARRDTTLHPSPSHFTRGRVDNPWFPLRPGNRLVYRGSEDGHRLRDVFLVTHRTAVVDGVLCRVVRDRLFQDGILRERTTDWYAQTTAGTVWYFGERTALLTRRGHVASHEGSFRSGRDGAEAGIFMRARPAVGQSSEQENYPGHAEDRFTVLRLNASISVPVIGSHHALLTQETTRLEPGVLDHKYYVRDIGTVREQTIRGGNESLRLVSIEHLR